MGNFVIKYTVQGELKILKIGTFRSKLRYLEYFAKNTCNFDEYMVLFFMTSDVPLKITFCMNI